MKGPDVQAICARHGIVVRDTGASAKDRRWRASDSGGDAYESTKVKAVCALLKQRHRITSFRYAATKLWWAVEDGPKTVPSAANFVTELDAVDSLATWLKEAR
jgi:hypothetical protein